MIRITSELGRYLGEDIVNGITWLIKQYMTALPILQFISFGVCALIVWGIFYSVTTSGQLEYMSDQRADRKWKKDMTARKMRRKWKSAMARIQNRNDRAEWTAALKDAESVVQEGFRVKGYAALNDSDRSRIAYEAGEYETLPLLKEAQAIYKKAKNEELPCTHDDAVAALRLYKKVIQDIGVLGEGYL